MNVKISDYLCNEQPTNLYKHCWLERKPFLTDKKYNNEVSGTQEINKEIRERHEAVMAQIMSGDTSNIPGTMYNVYQCTLVLGWSVFPLNLYSITFIFFV